jgi:signal transduction histidine kinase
MESKYEDIPFRASKLLTALRETGYDTYTAIMDIIDNSIDADATNIDIIISKREDDIIIDVADNGY